MSGNMPHQKTSANQCQRLKVMVQWDFLLTGQDLALWGLRDIAEN